VVGPYFSVFSRLGWGALLYKEQDVQYSASQPLTRTSQWHTCNAILVFCIAIADFECLNLQLIYMGWAGLGWVGLGWDGLRLTVAVMGWVSANGPMSKPAPERSLNLHGSKTGAV